MQALIDHYRAELRAGRLAFQHCEQCGRSQAFLRPFCADCGSDRVTWRIAGGRGTVASLSVVHRAPTPEFRDRIPYAILLVDLEEGLRVMTHGQPDLSMGCPVRLTTHALGEQYLLWGDPL
jgi:uncharacterized OB-fold protein